MLEHLTLETFKEKIMDFETIKDDWKFQGQLPAIIDFYADYCIPCKTIATIFEKLAIQYKDKINIYKIDIEDQQELASMFGIRSIPSVLFIPMEGEPQMTIGLLSDSKFKDLIDDVLL